jgi:putative MATE family efflux protein
MSVAAIYNLADRIFIGRFVGEEALGGLTVAFPFMMILFAAGALIGVGGSALISIRFGEKRRDEAQAIFGNMVTLTVVTSVACAVLGLVFITPMLRLMGATPNNLPFATEYMRIILCGLLLQLSSFSLAAIVRVEGKPKLAMTTQIISAAANIALDYLFIVVFGWGVAGAALATVAGQFIGFAVLIWHFFISGKSLLRLSAAHMRPSAPVVGQICAIGASSFFMQIGNSVSAAFMNSALGLHGGDAAISSMGAMHGLFTLALMPILGLQQGVGPIIGYNHGMRSAPRVASAMRLGMVIGAVFSTLVFAVVELWPATFAALFIDPRSPTMAMCVRAIRITFLLLPLLPVNVIGSTYFQSTAQALKAFVLSISRSVIFLIPLILALPPLFKLDGVWAALPLSDLLSIGLTAVLLAHSFHKSGARAKPAPG